MRRREFIGLVGGAAAWPVVGRAQQQAVPVVAFLNTSTPQAGGAGTVAAFTRGLAEAGFVEGRNVAFEARWAGNDNSLLPQLAADLVARRVAVIVALGASEAGIAAKQATSTIPIVVAGGADPVRYGLVASLNRPGGNVTGVSYLFNELAGKRLDLLRELVPTVTTFGYITDLPRDDTGIIKDMLVAAQALGREVIVFNCRDTNDFDAAFATMVERGAGAFLVSAFPLAFNNRRKIVALAAQYKLPGIYAQSAYAHEGGLMAYSADASALLQVAIQYVARILKGEKPADLPVHLPTKFDFVVNLKTARTLGLAIPLMLQVAATTVIE